MDDNKNAGFWSAGRLVIGIILIVLSLFVLFQSCAAGIYNTLGDTDDAGGTAGCFVAILMIAAGVCAIVSRNSKSKAGSIAAAIILLIGSVVAFFNTKVYEDLLVWGIVLILAAVVFIICAVKTPGKTPDKMPDK